MTHPFEPLWISLKATQTLLSSFQFISSMDSLPCEKDHAPFLDEVSNLLIGWHSFQSLRLRHLMDLENQSPKTVFFELDRILNLFWLANDDLIFVDGVLTEWNRKIPDPSIVQYASWLRHCRRDLNIECSSLYDQLIQLQNRLCD